MIMPLNKNGCLVCPNCKKEFKPILVRTDKPLQIEYPNSKPFEREQLISGICSDKCWKEFINF